MIGGAMVTTIKTLWEKTRNKTQIARMTGHDWKTVSKYVTLIENGKEIPESKPHPRLLDGYKEKILEWLDKDNLTGLRVFEKLKGEGIKIGYSTVKNYIAKIKKREKIFIRMHSKAGEEAQVDFGYVGLTETNEGKKKRTWIFNMRLSYSRMDYYEKVYNQRVETFVQCHINAFNYFACSTVSGGIPEYVKIDNLKAAILEANFYEPIYQEVYKMFASHYGFKPIPCRVREPNDKGKVESGIKYVKNNFFLGRKFRDGDDLDRRLKEWLNNRCNKRVHGTTQKVPFEVFEREEKDKLKRLPIEAFKMSEVGTRKVYHDCHIYVNYNYYSVPFEYVGKEVDIEITDKIVKVFYKNEEIAVHPRQEGRGNFCTIESHYPKYKMYSSTEYQEKYQSKMSEIGPYAEQIFFLLVNQYPREWNRNVQGILSLLKVYPKEVLDKACKRALAFEVYQFSIIRNICFNGSYNLPVEFDFSLQEDTNEYAQIQITDI